MNGILKVAKFQIRDSRNPIVIFYGVILGLLTLGTVAILRNPSGNGNIGATGLTTVVFIFILGLNSFTSAFKFMQANNVSRRRFYIATVLALTTIALFMSTIDVTIGSVLRQLITYNGTTEQLYGTTALFPELVWGFTFSVFAVHLGWLISMIYYRSTKLQKIGVSLSPLFAITLLTYFNRHTSGKLVVAILRFLTRALGFAGTPNPYVAALSFAIGTLGLAGLCFLLIRKMPVRD